MREMRNPSPSGLLPSKQTKDGLRENESNGIVQGSGSIITDETLTRYLLGY